MKLFFRPAPKNEDEMMVLIFEYIDRLFAIVRPRRLLYMAIDGVVSRGSCAKILQLKMKTDSITSGAKSQDEPAAISKVPSVEGECVSFSLLYEKAR